VPEGAHVLLADPIRPEDSQSGRPRSSSEPTRRLDHSLHGVRVRGPRRRTPTVLGVGHPSAGRARPPLTRGYSGQRLVARRSPLELLQRAVTRAQDGPRPGARAIYGEVGLAVAVVVVGDENIAARVPLELLQRPVTGAQDVPRRGARAVDGDVGLAVAVVVVGNGNVVRRSPLELLQRAVTGALDVPRPGARAVDGDVGLAVAVVVARDENIAVKSPLRL